ncbi:short-chain dehydrogenase/reductase SDR [Cystobasidium minutum MCA 4210]|uniref:short-chain dehydrogenase/reductase SDR n=1 Tax=Cystobasidium minutum MCA 4210 TaxID=1397322 RepID=UPI0034CEC4D3|eukprot:jgi/Rhomi1/186566/estExt_fgenesh1_pm.C_70125
MSESKGVAIITGASAGIGRASAIALGKDGWTVVVTARDEAKLKETASQIEKSHVIAGDLTSSGFVEKLFKETAEKFGRVDLVFNNAGMSIGSPSFEDVKLEDFERTIAVNLVAPFNIIKHAFLQMKSQSPQGGRIINNGSISAVTPRPGSAAYTSSKHAITGLTKTAALDGRKYNIAVSQIDIGNAATDMGAKVSSGSPQADGSTKNEPTFDVKHVASSIVYMASLPLGANVLSHTIMATNMPSWVGRG